MARWASGIIGCLYLFVGCAEPSKPNTALQTAPQRISESLPPRTVWAASVDQFIEYDAPLLALIGATVIDGTGAAPAYNQAVVLRDGWIHAVGSVDEIGVPAEAQVLNVEGRTIIPGIVGTHNHTHMPGYPFLPLTTARLYFASGLTTIQTTGSASPYAERTLARQIEGGFAPGPDIEQTGPYFTGEGGSIAMVHPRDEAHIREVIQYWTGEGVKWFKAYRHIAPEHLQKVIDIAHEHGAQVAGHLCSVTYQEAAKMGIDAIEHGFIHSFDLAEGKEPGTCSGNRDFRDQVVIDSEAVKQVHRAMIDHGVALSSTLSIFEAQTVDRGYADARTLEFMSPPLVDAYQRRRQRMEVAGDSWYFKSHWLQKSMAFDVAFFRAGGLLTAGLDPGLHNLPGFGDQRNAELLVEAGLSVPEAVQVMTSNGAKSLDLAYVGMIRVGKRADLVVLDGELANDPAVIREVEIVFKEGYGFSPDALLEEMKGQVGYR